MGQAGGVRLIRCCLPMREPSHDIFLASGISSTEKAIRLYNCIAWAIGEIHRPWWPNAAPEYFWPSDLPQDETLDSFIAAFRKYGGYEVCVGGRRELRFQKIALYVDNQGTPTHAARQTWRGAWHSKIGYNVDLIHKTLEHLEGGFVRNRRLYYATALDSGHTKERTEPEDQKHPTLRRGSDSSLSKILLPSGLSPFSRGIRSFVKKIGTDTKFRTTKPPVPSKTALAKLVSVLVCTLFCNSLLVDTADDVPVRFSGESPSHRAYHGEP